MKPVRFLGDSRDRLRDFPEGARYNAGYQLELLQREEQPEDFKPMPTVGRGVEEIRVRDDAGIFRVVYTARMPEAVYVLHAFKKKTQSTSQRDIVLARARYAELLRDR